MVLAVAANAFYTASANKSSSRHLPEVANPTPIKAIKGTQGLATKIIEESFPANTTLPAFMPQAALTPSIETYDSTCTTPKDTFVLGETVCAKTTGAPFGSPAQRSVTWSNPSNNVVDRSDLVVSANDTFTIPTLGTSIVDGLTVDNRGTWTVKLVPTGRSLVRASAVFTVTDPANLTADVSVYNIDANPGTELLGGSQATFKLYVVNNGPNAAQDVSITHVVPANATLVPSTAENPNPTQDAGPGFSCTTVNGLTTCTIASLPARSKSLFTFVYDIDNGATKGTVLAAQTAATSSTADLNINNNSWTAKAIVTGSSPTTTCTLDCPGDISISVNATSGGQPGAIVTFAGGDPNGDCGAITTSPQSGSFFPVGSTLVTSTSGGASCSFTVTVVDTSALTIACPAPQTITAPDGACEAAYNAVAPSATGTGTGITVEGERRDGQELTAPYGIGTTKIVWTATDDAGNVASCEQIINVVVGANSPAPTITKPPDVEIATPSGAFTGSCGLVIPETTLGSAEANNCTVNITRTGVPGGNFFTLGAHTITYTATDSLGRTATATQTVTVTDGTPPRIKAPADESYSCTSQVPAANVAQATRGDVYDVTGVLLPPAPPDDNCSAVIVTVSETSSGAGSASDPRLILRTFTATDAVGNSESDVQTITVIDNTPPTLLTTPADVELHTGAGATSCGVTINNLDATLGTGSASDSCSTATVVRSGVPANNIFPVGETTISYTAVDAAGNSSAPVTQKVTVVDDTPPTISAPADTTVNADTGSCSATGANLGTPTTADNCAVASVTNNAPSTLPLGETTVTWTVTDGAGHTATAAQKVTVVDNQNPTISAPANKTVNADAGSCGASGVLLGSPTTADNCSVASVTNDAPASYPVGTTTVTWTVTDGSGRTATAPQLVTVVDNQNPTITAPADKTLYTGTGATSCDVTVGNLNATLGTATANDNCPGVTVARGGGNVFPLGETLVTYTATDAHGNTASATQKVTVVDNTAPVVTPPASITVQLPVNSSATSMAVSYPAATATDNCAGAISLAYSKASGSAFNVGTTTVTVTATDAHNNSASATFTVTVLYNFTGFFSPIGNLPTLNAVNAGRAIPVKFSLSGNKGLNIFAANNPYTVAINCNSTDPSVDVTETLTAGGSSLSFGGDQYNYTWKTESSWANTCRQLVVTLNDGSVHRANFKFK
jgi:hypothetical protein